MSKKQPKHPTIEELKEASNKKNALVFWNSIADLVKAQREVISLREEIVHRERHGTIGNAATEQLLFDAELAEKACSECTEQFYEAAERIRARSGSTEFIRALGDDGFCAYVQKMLKKHYLRREDCRYLQGIYPSQFVAEYRRYQRDPDGYRAPLYPLPPS